MNKGLCIIYSKTWFILTFHKPSMGYSVKISLTPRHWLLMVYSIPRGCVWQILSTENEVICVINHQAASCHINAIWAVSFCRRVSLPSYRLLKPLFYTLIVTYRSYFVPYPSRSLFPDNVAFLISQGKLCHRAESAKSLSGLSYHLLKKW